MGTNVPLNSFVGAEIGLETLARIDLDLYPTTAEVMENILPTMRGSMIKAPGTEYIGTVDADPDEAIVRPFIFNVDQTRVLEIIANEIRFVDANAYVSIDGAAATVGTPVDNTSTGSASVAAAGQDITFTTVTGGIAKARWPITGGVIGGETTFSFEILRRPLKISVGSTTGGQEILSEITLDPGLHTITITPTATTYYIRAQLEETGKAQLIDLTRKAAGVLVIPTPYAASELRSLRFEQSNDVVWVYHPSHRTRVLERRGDASWSLRIFRPLAGPFEVMNVATTTLAPSATTGSINIVASVDLFSSSAVGQLIELEHQGQTEILNATAVDQASEPVRIIGTGESRKFYATIAGTFVGSIKLQRSFGNTVDWLDFNTYSSAQSLAIDDGLDNQIVYYRLLCSAYTSGTIECVMSYSGGSTIGRAEIVEYTNATTVVAEVLDPFGSTATTTRWSEGSWSDFLGWPAAGQIAESRHWIVRDDRLWGSVGGDYEDFEIGSEVNDAIARVVGTGDVNVAQWIEAGTRIVVGTAGSEIEILSNEYNEKITFLNINARPIGDDGSADAQAARAGKRIIYIDRTRARLLQAYFDSDSGAIETDDLTRLHEKIAGEIEEGSDDGFVEIAFQRAPAPRIWSVRSDGQLAVMLYAPKEGIYGWARVLPAATLDGVGKFKSICVVPGKPEDRVHVLVERVIDGVTVLYHERFALNRFPIVVTDGVRSAPKAWRLQCALATSGAPADTFGNLDHLEGETVRVWADGRDAGAHVVTGGEITIGFEASYAIIGLNYIGKWKSSKLAFGARNGTALGQDKTVGQLGIVVHETPRGAVRYGRSFEVLDPDEITGEFQDEMIMDAPADAMTEEVSQPFEGATETDSRVHLIMDTPAPVCVLALIPNVELEEHA